ncbi:MAG: alpha-hydroxy acid oxidase [Acidimicrobiales bacterium]|nr:alpha-hydroxy acid oxidase [Acidimicrobiales bacterium]
MSGQAANRRTTRRRAAAIGTFDDARRLAQRRVPRAVFDYVDGGAEAELTMRANREAFEAVGFVPRVGVTTGPADLSTTVLGTPVDLPVLLSPVGYTRLVHSGGDVAGARAAGAAGTIFTLSSMAGHTIEEVAAAATGPTWFQLYLLGGRPGAEQLIDRAGAAGYSALVVTMDSQIPGNRERDGRHGIKFPITMTPRSMAKLAVQLAPHPGWFVDFRRGGLQFDIPNAVSADTPGGSPMSMGEAIGSMTANSPTWADFAWIRARWDGPILAKGLVTADDARRAVDAGVDGVVVSNHGGRQLDGVAASLPALVSVVDAVGDQVEVLVDGGVRRGSDVARALALGARAVMIGRPWVFALAAGQPGVEQLLGVLRTDLDRTLRLLGCPSVAALGRSYVAVPDRGW